LDEDSLFDLQDLILLSGSQIFWLKDTATLVPIQDKSVLDELYREASQRLDKGTYLRSIAVTGSGTCPAAVITRKQLNVIETKALIEDRIISFFSDPNRFVDGNRKHVTTPVNGEIFENTVINKRTKKNFKQHEISELLRKAVEDGTSFEDMMYNGRRQRRLIGTYLTSHKFPPTAREDLFDSPLLSEVVLLR
jgi:hypothetical protein